jgi:hypothetical protein
MDKGKGKSMHDSDKETPNKIPSPHPDDSTYDKVENNRSLHRMLKHAWHDENELDPQNFGDDDTSPGPCQHSTEVEHGSPEPPEAQNFRNPPAVYVLKERVEKLDTDYELWHKVVSAQRRVFEKRFEKSRGGCRYVEQQLFNIKEEDYDASK